MFRAHLDAERVESAFSFCKGRMMFKFRKYDSESAGLNEFYSINPWDSLSYASTVKTNPESFYSRQSEPKACSKHFPYLRRAGSHARVPPLLVACDLLKRGSTPDVIGVGK